MESQEQTQGPTHFKGKDAFGHVVETQAQGILASSEIHGMEVPGHISAMADAARDTAMAFLLIWIVLLPWELPAHEMVETLSAFACGWVIWKMGRSAWLGWSRLERLHRMVSQEKYEIEHHRPQERDELRELYAAKGFEGKLLEDVLDVLMADDERLLRVMVQEEMNLTLESQEHPLKQGLGALVGSFIAAVLCLIALLIHPIVLLLTGLIVMGVAAGVTSHHARNELIPAMIWMMGLGVLACGSVYFLMEYLVHG